MFTRTANLFAVLFVIVIGSALTESYRNMLSSKEQNASNVLSVACNNFTIPLFKSLSIGTGNNVVISPLNLHMILSLLSNGAGGFTLKELKSVLHHDTVSLNDEFKTLILLLNNMGDLELRIANKVYIQDGFDLMADFLSTCTNIFQCSIARLDFKDNIYAAKMINIWIQETTNNKISNVISSDDIGEDTRIMLINAIYFKSKWLHTFDERNTAKRTFHVSKTETNLVPTMFKKSKYAYGKISTWHTTFIEIPYLIGLNTMFKDDADFRRLSNVPLKVSHALQKMFIEVNEEGSEAAAATVVGIRLKRMIISPMEFVVDRPFLFVIEHKPSRVPLFLGSVRKIEFSQERDEL
ncbi:antichymotrypsin-2-like isoform X4 [Pogonomyrmex barbatus]|uniref:Antichymotrypsin-2-like isoform X4 n=1 Tax=Pogonomyrmex barbatus TaxID=144034 RepID=A0A6I9WLS0_9HYME|nr:antichymotrypsin-2-like isoform X4 [Pogonomyrmex barbatus]